MLVFLIIRTEMLTDREFASDPRVACWFYLSFLTSVTIE